MAALIEALAGTLAKAVRIDDLSRLLDETEDLKQREALFAALAMAHVRNERPADGLAALNEIDDVQALIKWAAEEERETAIEKIQARIDALSGTLDIIAEEEVEPTAVVEA